MIYVGSGTCGRAAGALEVQERLKAEVLERKAGVRVGEVGCMGLCPFEPLVMVERPGGPGICYGNVSPEDVPDILRETEGVCDPGFGPVLCTVGGEKLDGIPHISDLPLFKHQVRIALRRCGRVDPGSIAHTILLGGYRGLGRALKTGPGEVVSEVGRSGLRGRGGAGFPVADKWRACRNAPGREKVVICNAAEGDPEAVTARVLLESDPHGVLEGMLIGAYAVGAARGYIYVNPGYGLALERVGRALAQMEAWGLLGEGILDSGFSFRAEVAVGAAGPLSGEETAILGLLEGGAAVPRPRPPYPSTAGLEGSPTLIQNAETWAHVSAVFEKGAAWYAGFGTEQSRGTKVFCVSGRVERPAPVEVPLGTTLRRIVYDMAGGVQGGEEFKAAQIGGPAGGFLAAEDLDLPLDYEHLAGAGCSLGSGGLRIAGGDARAVQLAGDALRAIHAESCGRCVFGREGARQLSEILADIAQGKGTRRHLDFLVELGEGMKQGALCGMGRSAPDPVLTTLRRFRGEYEDLLRKR